MLAIEFSNISIASEISWDTATVDIICNNEWTIEKLKEEIHIWGLVNSQSHWLHPRAAITESSWLK